MLRFAWLLLWTALATLVARLTRGPGRPGWTFAYEAMARALKRHNAWLATQTPQRRRVLWEEQTLRSPVERQLRYERASLGGVPAEWMVPRDAPPSAPVLFYLHGGSFIFGSARTHRDVISRFALACGARAVAVEYRLAPEHPCPAAVEDALAAYRALLASGVAPSQVVVAGESAGAALALALAQAARDAGEPLPAGLALLCPWVDLSARGGSLVENARYDWGEPEDFEDWERFYLGGGSLDAKDPRASPGLGEVRGLPPVLMRVGGAEMLLDQAQALAAKLLAAGVPLDAKVVPDMVHAWFFIPALVPQARETERELGEFVRQRTAAGTGAVPPAAAAPARSREVGSKPP